MTFTLKVLLFQFTTLDAKKGWVARLTAHFPNLLPVSFLMCSEVVLKTSALQKIRYTKYKFLRPHGTNAWLAKTDKILPFLEEHTSSSFATSGETCTPHTFLCGKIIVSLHNTELTF